MHEPECPYLAPAECTRKVPNERHSLPLYADAAESRRGLKRPECRIAARCRPDATAAT